MRKWKLQMQVSVDGFVAGPNGEMDWMVLNWDEAVIKLCKLPNRTGRLYYTWLQACAGLHSYVGITGGQPGYSR